MSLSELRSPGAQPVRLGVTVGNTVSDGAAGTIAIGAGGNRYAWLTKDVEICSTARATCSPLRAPAHELTLDPAWSPNGATLAYVEAASEPTASAFTQPALARWYATHSLWLLHVGAKAPAEIPGTQGAASPVWSSDGRSLLYVSADALWLIPTPGAKPLKIAAPLLAPTWPN
jgi:hypothetical protein